MAADAESMRVDRFLWFARFAKTRSVAQAIVEKGTLRIDGRRVERCSTLIRPGSVVAFPQDGRVRVLRILTIPKRRGPATEARACYSELLTNPLPVPAPPPCSENGSQKDSSN